MQIQSAVKSFHDIFDIGHADSPGFPSRKDRDKRMNLLEEEFVEYVTAENNDDLIGVADALADMVYIVFGTALEYGIDLNAVLREVHRSNMTKMEPCPACQRVGIDAHCMICRGRGFTIKKRDDGKILKGSLYEPPNIGAVLDKPTPDRDERLNDIARDLEDISGQEDLTFMILNHQDANYRSGIATMLETIRECVNANPLNDFDLDLGVVFSPRKESATAVVH